jgi:hypothetical protein
MTSHAANSPGPIIFAVILATASVVGLLIVVSPNILTFHDPSAISVSASLSSTDVGQNQTIKVTVSDVNGLRFPNELPLSGNWRVQNLSMGPCSFYEYYPYGIALYQGKYTLDNLSSATSIAIYAPGFYGCGAASFTNSFTFKPLQNVSSYVELRGYWTKGETTLPGGLISEGVLHPFLPGQYTVVAGDEWGHAQVLYFRVAPTSTTTTSTASISTPGGGATGTSSTSPTSSTLPTNGKYAVTFQQVGACSPEFWGVPWSVTIGSVTEVQPPDTKLPLDNYSLSGTSNSGLSKIAFSLANGTYEYRVSPSASFFTPTSGTVNVAGSSVTVSIAYTGTSCIGLGTLSKLSG